MSVNLNPVKIYDPVMFINENISLIIPENSSVTNVTFSGFIKRKFHTNKRPNGIITILYKAKNSANKIQLFVKQHAKAIEVYNKTSYIYSHLSSNYLKAHIPKPILCDEINNANYMEYIEGEPLVYKVLGDLVIQRAGNLSGLFYKIGQWLKNYHSVSKLENTVTVSEIKEKIFEALEKTPFFNSTEKTKIVSNLKKLVFEDTFLILTYTHNDFAMRNIMYSKANDFHVIDWDAMFHEKFTTESPFWNDITSFIISVNSLQRFSPVVTIKNLKVLTDSFLYGYFENLNKPLLSKEINNQLYLFSLCFYLGVIGDRALPHIYKEKLGSRFINKLHFNLLKGIGY